MRLLMKGGGCKSRKHQREPYAPEMGSIDTVQQEYRKTKVVAKQDDRKRLNLKRPREAHEDRENSERQCCP